MWKLPFMWAKDGTTSFFGGCSYIVFVYTFVFVVFQGGKTYEEMKAEFGEMKVGVKELSAVS
jgi:hypothetical protein